MSIITSLVGQLYFFRFDHPLYYHLSNEAKGQCLSCIDITWLSDFNLVVYLLGVIHKKTISIIMKYS